MLLVALLGEKSVALLFQCQFIKVVFLTCTNRTSVVIFQKIVPDVNSANFWNPPLEHALNMNAIILATVVAIVIQQQIHNAVS